MTAPKWMSKHQCVGCNTGYGFCAQGLRFSLKCCENCEHPSRWKDNAYTEEDYKEMKT